MDATAIGAAMEAAGRAMRGGDRAQAVRLYAQVVERGGEVPAALNALGNLAAADGRHGEAEGWLRRAIAADPAAPELWINLAKAMRERGDVAGERAALEGALAIDRRQFLALVRMAELLERTGDAGGAVEYWAGVTALAPMIAERGPAMEAMLAHAEAAVARHREMLAAGVDAAVAAGMAAASAGERRRAQACIDQALGRRRIYTNRCEGLHFPFLPADEFFDRAHFPWMEEIEARTPEIRAELEELLRRGDAGFEPYIAQPAGTPDNLWSALDGRHDWDALHLWKDGRRDDAACARAPRTAAAVEALPLSDLPGRTPTVFFSLLRPGTRLPAHTGVSNVRTIVHLPLIVPEACGFRVGGETREWEEGKAWAFDDTIEHEAWNLSDRVRGILIFDVWNPYIAQAEREVLRRFYAAADASGRALGGAGRVSD